ncbi:unnamed protein product [Spirodela intermedia]|uniref:Uncharacterized protein n=1 Tax=Spirodela intermedia TaxID=51605 RepID=A0A7I8KWQ8_SPIIN|nr:unnamed protein product [Spirodela intermedia]
MDEGEEDFVFYGTPIEREEETSRRKRKAVADAGQMRSLPVWKQEVTDEEGRRRFHGAFTGGFSAGYYNTVGSKEGWTPQTFTSSRKNRAEVKKQSIYSFLDDDEKAELGGHGLETSLQFDTFGFTAAEVARKQAEKEQQMRPSAIPGPAPDEIVLPATNSIGVKLLLKMGWRHGHSIKSSHTGKLYDARREARKAFLALSGNDDSSEIAELEPSKVDSQNLLERHNDSAQGFGSTPVFVLEPKKDLHGLGFDPFKNAPEFRERKALHTSGSKDPGTRNASRKGGLFVTNCKFLSGKLAPGFGIGALEEADIEDEDIYASNFEFEEPYVEEAEQPLRIEQDSKLRLTQKEHNVIRGFKAASNADYNTERFRPPVIPPDFQPHHKFLVPLQVLSKLGNLPPPPEAPAPEEKDLKLLIDGFATLVARCGKLYEDLSRDKNKANPLFSFLSGGKGHDYYARKLWEEQQKRPDHREPQVDGHQRASSVRKMTAESRGRILGEKPLKRSDDSSAPSPPTSKQAIQLQYNLSDSFTTPESLAGLPESVKPFRDDPMKQARFEQFLKDKYQGGLRSTYAAGNSTMTEADRARERLDFEAAAEALSQGKPQRTPQAQPLPLVAMQFVSGGAEKTYSTQHEAAAVAAVAAAAEKNSYPKREEFQWRPSPVLCKRFDLVDPFMGKPPPLPRARSKVETLIIMPEVFKSKFEEAADSGRDTPASSRSEMPDQIAIPEADSQPEVAITERPVDLYKAIFSEDDEDGDDEEEDDNPADNPAAGGGMKAEGGNTTLNRLIAGDFLQSLGQELGLEVPELPPLSSSRKPAPAAISGEPVLLPPPGRGRGKTEVNLPGPSEGSSPAAGAGDFSEQKKQRRTHSGHRRSASDGSDSESSQSDGGGGGGSRSDSDSRRKKRSSHRSRKRSSKHRERSKSRGSPSRRSSHGGGGREERRSRGDHGSRSGNHRRHH